eukprot:scaffold151184_cov12-Prasinocladus_malaysianus.AAC.1
MEIGFKPDTESPLLEDVTPYALLVGSHIYDVNTRPDIAAAVSVLCRFMSRPTTNHWKAANGVLRYIKGTIDVGLIYRRQVEQDQANIITVYADASYANMPEAKSVDIDLVNGASFANSSTTQKAALEPWSR